jgi:hypothetical protein
MCALPHPSPQKLFLAALHVTTTTIPAFATTATLIASAIQNLTCKRSISYLICNQLHINTSLRNHHDIFLEYNLKIFKNKHFNIPKTKTLSLFDFYINCHKLNYSWVLKKTLLSLPLWCWTEFDFNSRLNKTSHWLNFLICSSFSLY